VSLASVDIGQWAGRRGSVDIWHRAFVIERLGRFPYPAIAKMGGVSEAFVRALADEVGFTPKPRVVNDDKIIWPERGSRDAPAREWRPSIPTRARQAIQAVAQRHGLGLRDLMITSLASNRRIYAWARQEAYADLRALGYSYPLIGTWFKRDHSTIIYGEAVHLERNPSPQSTSLEDAGESRTEVAC